MAVTLHLGLECMFNMHVTSKPCMVVGNGNMVGALHLHHMVGVHVPRLKCSNHSCSQLGNTLALHALISTPQLADFSDS